MLPFYPVAGNMFIQSSSLKWMPQQTKCKLCVCLTKERPGVKPQTLKLLFLKPEPLSERPSLNFQRDLSCLFSTSGLCTLFSQHLS